MNRCFENSSGVYVRLNCCITGCVVDFFDVQIYAEMAKLQNNSFATMQLCGEWQVGALMIVIFS